jgi:beta-lactamase class A
MMKKIQSFKQFTPRKLRSVIAAFSLAVVIISCSVLPEKQQFSQLSWQTFDTDFIQLAEQSSFLAAEIKSEYCDTVHEIEAEKSLGVGSSFKLYILSELAHQIADQTIPMEKTAKGEEVLSWNSLLPIQQRFKSIPGGSLLFVPDNTSYTLRYFAEQMIQRSDNTATDHLLFLLGREQIEKRMLLDGHHNPQLNTPLMATREFAVLKFLYNDNELAEYLALTTINKRAVLAKEQRGYQQLEQYFQDHGEQQESVRIDSIEWFANAENPGNVALAKVETK